MGNETEQLHLDVLTNAPEAEGGVNALAQAFERVQIFVAKMEAELAKFTGATVASTGATRAQGEANDALARTFAHSDAVITANNAALAEAALASANAARATATHGAAHVATAAHVAEDGTALEGLAGALRQVETHSVTVARGLQALGLEAEAGAVKVGALTEVLEGLGGAIGPLLLIGGVIAAATFAFGFLKESVDEAARSERELVTIGALLRNQSVANYHEQAKAVDEYASAIARTTIFQKTDALAGMQAMLVAGLSYNDMIRSQVAAMDLAAARSITLAEADQSLADAYDGRFRGLVKLGIVTKEEQANGIEYEKVLERIEQRMSGTAAAALDTYSGKVQNLHNLVGLLQEEFGNALLPILGAFEDEMRAGVSAMAPLADEFRTWTKEHLPQLKAGAEGFGNAIMGIAREALPPLEQGVQELMKKLAELGEAWGKDGTAATDWGRSIQEAKTNMGSFVDAGAGLTNWLNETNAAFQNLGMTMHDWAVGAVNWIGGVIGKIGDLTNNGGFSMMGGQMMAAGHGGKEGAGVSFGATDDQHLGVGPTLARAKDLGLKTAVKPDAKPASIAPPTRRSSKFIAGTAKPKKGKGGSTAAPSLIDVTPLDHYKAKTDELKTALAGLNEVIHQNDDAETKAKAAIGLATTAEGEKAAKAAYSALVLKDLQLKLDAYNNEMVREDATTQFLMDRKAAEIKTHDNLVDSYDKLIAKKAAHGGLSGAEELQLQNLKGQIDASGKKIEDYTHQIDANTTAYNGNVAAARRVQAEIAGVRDLSLDAEAAQARAEQKAATDAEKAWAKFTDLEQQRMAESLATFQMTNAQKAVLYQQMLNRLAASDEDYDAKRKELTKRRDDAEIADYQDRIKQHDAMVKTIEDREKSYLDGIILQHRSLRDTLKSIFNDILTDFVHMIEQMILKSAMLSGINGSIMAAFGGGAGSGGSSLLSTLPGGLNLGGAAPGASPSNPLFTTAQSSGAPYNLAMTGSSTGVPGLGAGGANAGPLIIAYIGSQILSNSVADALAHGDPGAAARGKAAGTIFGPLGAFVGTTLGPHWGPETNYPDRSDPTYKAWLDSFNSGPGGGGDRIEKLIAGTDPKQLTGQALADYQKLKGLEGGTGQLGIVSEKDGIFTLISGMKIAVTDFRATVDRFGQEMTNLGLLAPSFILTRTYPDFNIANTGGAGSSGDPVTGAGQVAGGITGTGTGGGGGGKQVVVHNDFTGALIVGPGGMDEAAVTISQSFQRVATGEIAGGPRSTRYSN